MIYIFHRTEGWYSVDLRDDEDARKNAELNPGTVRVETPEEPPRIVWEPTRH